VTVLNVGADGSDQSGEFALWVGAAIVVLALHVGLAVAYLWLRPEPETRAEAPAFEVAFMPATSAPAAPPSVDQPDPAPAKMDQPQETPKDLTPPPVQEQPPPPPMPQVESTPPPPPVQEPPPPTPQVEAMVPPEEPPPPAPAPPIPVPSELPPPPPVPEQATIVPVEKPPEVTVPDKPVVAPEPTPKVTHEEKIEKREKAEKREEKVEKRQTPPKSVASPGNKPMRVASAPNPGAESEGARMGRESWLNQFAAQIRRAASYPSGSTGSGTAQVSVTVARNGRLVSRRLIASAGSPALDSAALAAIERAQPFPPFPASMPEAQVTKIVPMHLRPQ